MNKDNKQNLPREIRGFYGKFPPDILADIDSLLLKLQGKNKGLLKKKVIKKTEIKPLCNEEYLRLWGYLRHCCDMMTTWPNVRRAIGVFAEKSGRSFDSLQEECVDSMTVFVYTYAWRKYEHSEDCGYVFSTAIYGFKSWVAAQNQYHSGAVAAKEVFEADYTSGGRKVT